MEIVAPLIAVLALLLGTILRTSNNTPRINWSLPIGFYPLIALYLTVIIGVFYNDLPFKNALHAIGKLRWIVLYFFLHNAFAHLKMSSKAPSLLIKLSPLITTIAVFAFSQFWTGFDLLRGADFEFPIAFRPDFHTVRWRSIGFFNNPLTYGYSFSGFLCLLAPILLLKIKTAFKNKTSQSFWLIYSSLCLLSLLLSIGTTYARGVWIALIAGLFMTFFNLNKKLFLSTALLFTIILAVYIPTNAELKERVTSIVDLNYTSNLERLKIWRANIHMFLEHPIVGVGYEYNDQIIGDYYKQLKIKEAPESHAHNTYIQFLAGTGALGLLSFLCFLFSLLRKNLALMKSKTNYLFYGTFGLFTTILAGGLTECNFKDAEVNHLFIYFAAIVSAATITHKAESNTTEAS